MAYPAPHKKATPPAGIPADTPGTISITTALPTDVATLQTQLRLALTQNADLHRHLQHHPAPASSPQTPGLVPTGQRGPEGFASLEEEVAHLKSRLAKAEETFRTQKAQYDRLA